MMGRLWNLAVDAAGAACAELLEKLWPSEATAAETLLVEAEAERDVFEPLDCPGCSDLCCPGPPASAPGPRPPVDADGPTPLSPEGGVGHPSTPVVDVSQPAATHNGETVGAAETRTSGGGVDRPLSELLDAAAREIRYLTWMAFDDPNARIRTYRFAAELRDIANQFRAIDE